MHRRLRVRGLGAIAIGLFVVPTVAGCGGPTGPEPAAPRPVAVAQIEVRLLASSHPDSSFDACVQTGGAVRLKAGASYDPKGQPLRYEWSDTVWGGMPSADFLPRTNPFETADAEVATGLYTIAIHDITLTVTARDGRKSRTTLHVLVTGCEDCGG